MSPEQCLVHLWYRKEYKKKINIIINIIQRGLDLIVSCGRIVGIIDDV